MKKKLAVAVISSAFMVMGCAGEQSRVYKTLDSNEDGYISPGEGAALEGLTENWEMLDVDHDGQLDKAEFAKFEIEPLAPRANKSY